MDLTQKALTSIFCVQKNRTNDILRDLGWAIHKI